MDLNSMKRKNLQALCKKHGIPANTTNSLMIDSLSSILQEKTKPKGCLKGSGGSSAEDVGAVRGASKKVTFVCQDEESAINSVRKSTRKSARRSSSVASGSVDERSEIESPEQVDEVPRRATRSRGLAESVVWSPVIRKKSGPQGVQQNSKVEKSHAEGIKDVDQVPQRATRSRGLVESVLGSPVIDKKEKDGIGGVRQHAKKEKDAVVAQVPATRSLRNRVVVVGEGEESAKRIHDVKKEEEAVGKKTLNKRSRVEDTVEGEPPLRRSTSSHAKTVENVATGEHDAGRSKKRRKIIGEETERLLKPEVTSKRSRGNTFDSSAVESGDVTGPARRSTHSSLALSEVGNLTLAVGRSDQEGSKAVRKGKPRRPVKGRSLLVEPVRRSTRISSSEEDTSIKGGELARKGKSENKATFLSASDVAAVSARRSVRSSSALQEDKTSAIEGGETVGKGQLQKQAKEKGGLKGGVLQILSPVAAEPAKRSTRHSSNLTVEGISLSVVGEGKSRTRAKDHGSMGGGSSVASLADDGVMVEPVRRSARSSPSLLEKKTSPVIGKPIKEGKAAKKGKSSLSDHKAIVEPAKRLIRSSPKMLEDKSHIPAVGKSGVDNESIGNSKARKRQRDNRIEMGDSSVSLSDSGAVISPARRLSRGHGDAIRMDNSLKKTKACAVEEGDLATSLLDNKAVATAGRRSTRGSVMVSADGEALKSPFSLHLDNKSIRTPASRLTRHSLKVLAESDALKSPLSSHPDNEASITSAKRLTRHSLVPAGSEVLKSPRSPDLVDEDITTASRRSTCHLSKGSVDGEVMKSPCSSHSDTSLLEDTMEDAHGKTKSSRKEVTNLQEEQVDTRRAFSGGTDIVGQTSVASFLDANRAEVSNDVDVDSASQKGQFSESVMLERIERGTSLVGTLKDPDNVSLSAHIIEGHSTLVEAASNSRDETPVNIAEGFSEVQEDFSGKLWRSDVDDGGVPGTLESYRDGRDAVSTPIEPTSSTINNKKASVSVLHVDVLTNIESENIISPPVPPTNTEERSNVEVDPDREDIVTVHANVPQLQCKSSDEQSMTSGAEASSVLASTAKVCSDSPCFMNKEESDSKLNVHIGNKGSMESTEAANNAGSPLATSHIEFSPEVDINGPDLRVHNQDMSKVSSDFGASLVEASGFHSKTLEVSMTAERASGSLSNIQGSFAAEAENCKVGAVTILAAQLVPEKCDEEENIGAFISGSKSQSCIGVEDISSTSSVKVNANDATKGTKSSDEMNGSEPIPSSPNENPACDLATGDFLKEGGSPSSTARLTPEEYDAGEKIEVSVSGSESQSCIAVEVIKETWLSSTSSAMVNDDGEAEGDITGAGNNGDKLRPSSPSENPACDLDTCDYMKGGGSPSLTSPLVSLECDAGEMIEASIAGSELPSCIGVEVIKETWVSSTFSVTANDDVGTEGGKSAAEKNGDEPRPSSPSENPEFDMDTCDYMKEAGSPSTASQLTPEECVAGGKLETSIAGRNSQSRMDVQVVMETWLAFPSSITVNDDAATEGSKSGAEKNGSELRPYSPSENPECDLGIGVHMEESENPECDMGIGVHMEEERSPSSTALLSLEECDAGKNIEASIAGSESQSCTGVKVIKETGVSSLIPIMVNDGHEGKNGDEPMPPSSEHPTCDIDTVVHMKEQRSASLIEETVDDMGTLYSHGDLEKSDFIKSFNEKDLADVEANTRDSFDDKFWEDSSQHSQSPVASKDSEPIPNQLPVAFSKVIEGKPFIDHGSSMQRLAASGDLVKQPGKEDGLLVGNVESSDTSALTIENRCPYDAVLCGGDTKAGDLPIFPVHITCDEEILPSTNYETPATLGSKGSINEGDIQDFPCIPDSEAATPSDRDEIALSATQSVDTDYLNESPKSAPKGQEASQQLNVIANVLSETVYDANELSDDEHENLVVAPIKAEEVVNIESLEKKASLKGKDDIVVKKADSTGWNTFDRFDEFCVEQDEDFLVQSGEPCPRDVASYLTVDNSASTLGDRKVTSRVDFASAAGMENDLSSNNMDMVFSDEDQLMEHNNENACTEEEALGRDEFPCSDSPVRLATQKEIPAVYQCEDKEENTPLHESSEVWKQKMVMKIGGSPTVMFKSEEIEVASTSTIAKQTDLIAGSHSELHMANVADQVVSSNFEESPVRERRRPIEHELEDPEFKESCIHQHASSSLGAGDVGVSSATTQENIVSKDEARTPEEYFEDFCWPFPDTADVDSSQHEVQEIDPQLPIRSITPEAAHSAKSDSDTSNDQNRSSDIDQTEDGKDNVQCTPMQQQTRNLEPSAAVIDNAIRNKENTVGLKMGSTQKPNEKSAVSSRRPLQSVPKTKTEY